MLCCGWKPFCGHKNNRKKRRMGRKPCASFLGYQNFQPRTAVSGANFEIVPFEAPSIGRMPLGNPCWTLRAFTGTFRIAVRPFPSFSLQLALTEPLDQFLCDAKGTGRGGKLAAGHPLGVSQLAPLNLQGQRAVSLPLKGAHQRPADAPRLFLLCWWSSF